MLWKGILVGVALFMIQFTPGVSTASDWDDFSGEIYIDAMLPAVNSIIVSGVWRDHHDGRRKCYNRHRHGKHSYHRHSGHRGSHHYTTHHGRRHHASHKVVHHRQKHRKPHAFKGKRVAHRDGKGRDGDGRGNHRGRN